jgi:hypothetical protein
MRRREDAGWLDIGGREGGELTVQDHGCLHRVVGELPHPKKQYPAVFLFLGGVAKDSALRKLFPHNNIKRTSSRASISLRSDNASVSSPMPILFADGNPQATPGLGREPTTALAAEHPIAWNASCARQALRLVYSRLLFVFADVVCIFANDFPRLQDVAEYLINSACSSSSLPLSVRPRLVVAVSDRDGTKLEGFHQRLSVAGWALSQSFSAIYQVYLDAGLLKGSTGTCGRLGLCRRSVFMIMRLIAALSQPVSHSLCSSGLDFRYKISTAD